MTIVQEVRQCSTCDKTQGVENFYTQKYTKANGTEVDYLISKCKGCYRSYNRAKYLREKKAKIVEQAIENYEEIESNSTLERMNESLDNTILEDDNYKYLIVDLLIISVIVLMVSLIITLF